jgi:hypothetical protein
MCRLNSMISNAPSEIAAKIVQRFWLEVCEEGGLYRLLVDPTKHGALVHDNGKLSELWHKCFGHLHYGALPLLKDMVQGLPTSRLRRLECARDVHSGNIQKLHFHPTAEVKRDS